MKTILILSFVALSLFVIGILKIKIKENEILIKKEEEEYNNCGVNELKQAEKNFYKSLDKKNDIISTNDLYSDSF